MDRKNILPHCSRKAAQEIGLPPQEVFTKVYVWFRIIERGRRGKLTSFPSQKEIYCGHLDSSRQFLLVHFDMLLGSVGYRIALTNPLPEIAIQSAFSIL